MTRKTCDRLKIEICLIFHQNWNIVKKIHIFSSKLFEQIDEKLLQKHEIDTKLIIII